MKSRDTWPILRVIKVTRATKKTQVKEPKQESPVLVATR